MNLEDYNTETIVKYEEDYDKKYSNFAKAAIELSMSMSNGDSKDIVRENMKNYQDKLAEMVIAQTALDNYHCNWYSSYMTTM